MQSQLETLLCRYEYDPLDRLGVCTPFGQSSTLRFYLKDRLSTEIEYAVHRSIFQNDDQVLAQYMYHGGVAGTILFATDLQHSVLNVLEAGRQPESLVYTPYGHRPLDGGLLSLLGFNGERTDPVTGHYLLGNGYRAFNPVLMRFNSPDNLSPFGKGGLNAYAYCTGDPVNYEDRSGHTPGFLKSFLRGLGVMRKPRPMGNVVQRNVIGERSTSSDANSNKPSLSPVGVTPDFKGFGPPEVNLTFQKSSFNNAPKTMPINVRVTNESKRTLYVVDIKPEQMVEIKAFMRVHKGSELKLSTQSAAIRGITGLDPLPDGEYYRFPNSREVLTVWPDGSRT
jgi:RHS repeat-associated protein